MARIDIKYATEPTYEVKMEMTLPEVQALKLFCGRLPLDTVAEVLGQSKESVDSTEVLSIVESLWQRLVDEGI